MRNCPESGPRGAINSVLSCFMGIQLKKACVGYWSGMINTAACQPLKEGLVYIIKCHGCFWTMSQFIHLRSHSINSEWTYKTEWERCTYLDFQTKCGKWQEAHYLNMSYKHFDRVMSSLLWNAKRVGFQSWNREFMEFHGGDGAYLSLGKCGSSVSHYWCEVKKLYVIHLGMVFIC